MTEQNGLSRQDAALLLGVAVSADSDEVKRRYRLLARATHPDAGGDEEADAYQDKKERQKLAPGEKESERGVWLAVDLANDPQHGIADEESACQNAVWEAESCSQNPQDGKEHRSLQECGVNLRRVARCEMPRKDGMNLR